LLHLSRDIALWRTIDLVEVGNWQRKHLPKVCPVAFVFSCAPLGIFQCLAENESISHNFDVDLQHISATDFFLDFY
jgi:hypothetical protein